MRKVISIVIVILKTSKQSTIKEVNKTIFNKSNENKIDFKERSQFKRDFP